MPYVVTMVHGTWAPGATWTRPDSPLSVALKAEFGPELELRSLGWSGKNGHAARHQAANQLRDRLLKEPGVRHVLICHSHAGNIALYALRDPAVRRSVAGVACLATPFLVARRRDLDRQDEWLISMACMAPFIALYCAIEYFYDTRDTQPLTVMFLYLGLIAAVVGLSLGVHMLRLYADTLCSEMEMPNFNPGKLLIVRSSGDEASLVLVFGQLLSTATTRVYLWGKSRFSQLRIWMGNRRPLQFVACAVLCTMLVFYLLTILAKAIDTPFYRGFLGIIGMVVLWMGFSLAQAVWHSANPRKLEARLNKVMELPAFFLMGLIWLLMVALSLILLFTLGPRLAFANMFLNLTTESTPPGLWHVCHVAPPGATGPDGAVPLTHAVYANPEAIRAVCTWMKGLGDSGLD